MKTESDGCGKEGLIKSELTDRHFRNKLFDIRFSDLPSYSVISFFQYNITCDM